MQATKFVQLVSHGNNLYALDDLGGMWARYSGCLGWEKVKTPFTTA